MSIATTRDPYALLNLSRTSDVQSSIWYGIKAHMKSRNSMPTGPIISLYGYSDASSVTGNYPVNTVIGVFGRAFKKGTGCVETVRLSKKEQAGKKGTGWQKRNRLEEDKVK